VLAEEHPFNTLHVNPTNSRQTSVNPTKHKTTVQTNIRIISEGGAMSPTTTNPWFKAKKLLIADYAAGCILDHNKAETVRLMRKRWLSCR
jgi:hypothetical protein